MSQVALITGVAGIAVAWDNKFSILETIAEKSVLPYFPAAQNTLNNPIAQPLVSTALFCLEEPRKAYVTKENSLPLQSKIGLNLALHCAKGILNMNGYSVASTLDVLSNNNNIFFQKAMSFCRNFWMLILTPERITALADFAYRLRKSQ